MRRGRGTRRGLGEDRRQGFVARQDWEDWNDQAGMVGDRDAARAAAGVGSGADTPIGRDAALPLFAGLVEVAQLAASDPREAANAHSSTAFLLRVGTVAVAFLSAAAGDDTVNHAGE